jgi:hypothetical protein
VLENLRVAPAALTFAQLGRGPRIAARSHRDHRSGDAMELLALLVLLLVCGLLGLVT